MTRDDTGPIDVAGIASRQDPLDRIELPIEVRLGRLRWSLERVLGLRIGDAVPVGAEEEDMATLYVQGQPFATGDLVVVHGRFGFRVGELVDGGVKGRR